MATANSIRNRSQIVRELQSIATQARREGNRQVWEEARRLWQARASDAEQRKAPASITRPWEGA